jgi:hypothetical protein
MTKDEKAKAVVEGLEFSSITDAEIEERWNAIREERMRRRDIEDTKINDSLVGTFFSHCGEDTDEHIAVTGINKDGSLRGIQFTANKEYISISIRSPNWYELRSKTAIQPAEFAQAVKLFQQRLHKYIKETHVKKD